MCPSSVIHPGNVGINGQLSVTIPPVNRVCPRTQADIVSRDRTVSKCVEIYSIDNESGTAQVSIYSYISRKNMRGTAQCRVLRNGSLHKKGERLE